MKDGFDDLTCKYCDVNGYRQMYKIKSLKEENKQLKQCNECMRYQLDHKPFDCKCSLDDSCEWTRNVEKEAYKKEV
jgi:hypothetical protein